MDFDVLESANPETNPVITLGEHFASTYNAYQQIYLNLTLLQYEKIPPTISITSSSAREGKSEISANIAAMLAQSGYQVLLVDASLRNPSQHKLWKLENNVGLSDVLSDSVNASLVRQKVAPNLHVITAGRTIPHMSIISRYSEALSFIDQVSKQYDCVIFDTGSIFDEPDAISLSRACEGTILVACLKQLQIGELQNAKALFAQAHIPVLGLIANQVANRDIKKFRFFNPLQSIVKREAMDMSSEVTTDTTTESLDIVNS